MSPTPVSLTQKWLKQNTAFYTSPDRVYSDADAVLSRYTTLRPKTDVYTYDDGRTQLLLCIHGLLPITFRNATYNIPIALWLSLNHPRDPPLVYVVPTNDMLIKSGKHIDLSGRCDLEYTSHWRRKPEACSLTGLLEAMQELFSRDPPVYAKPRSISPQQQQTSPAQQFISSRSHDHVTQSTNSAVQPPLPPKPHAQVAHLNAQPSGASTPSPVSLSSPSGISSTPVQSGTQSPTLTSTASPPPPPPRPVPIHPRVVSSQSQTVGPGPPPYVAPAQWTSIPRQNVHSIPPPPHIPGIPQSNTRPQSSPQSISPQNPPVSPPVVPSVPSTPQYPLVSQDMNSIIPPPLARPTPTAHATPRYVVGQVYAPPTRPAPSIPPPDLLDEDDLSNITNTTIPLTSNVQAPPRPPNPELLRIQSQLAHKLQEALSAMSASTSETTTRQQAIQRDLLAGGPAVRDEMGRLVAVRDVCRAVSNRMREVIREGENNLVELRRKGEPEVDELVCSTTIVHNQLINLIAEDNAIEDTLYHLHRALNSGRIDLERFLRTTRVLAEEQFMKRALVEKILDGIPMGMSVS